MRNKRNEGQEGVLLVPRIRLQKMFENSSSAISKMKRKTYIDEETNEE
jgi:hypothetical protein